MKSVWIAMQDIEPKDLFYLFIKITFFKEHPSHTEHVICINKVYCRDEYILNIFSRK